MCVSICLFLFLFRFVYMYTHLEPKHVFGGYTANDGGCLLFERTIAKAVEYPNSLFQKTHQFWRWCLVLGGWVWLQAAAPPSPGSVCPRPPWCPKPDMQPHPQVWWTPWWRGLYQAGQEVSVPNAPNFRINFGMSGRMTSPQLAGEP